MTKPTSLKHVIALLTLTSLAACGGGSSDDYNTSNTTTETTQTTPTASLSNEFSAISGVFNTSRLSDEAYLHIAEDGLVTAFDYQQDIFGTGENCYITATTVNRINGQLTGAVITVDGDRYTLNSGDIEIEFSYDDLLGMNDFLYNNVLSSNTGLNINAANVNILLGDAGALQSTQVTIEDIESAICQ